MTADTAGHQAIAVTGTKVQVTFIYRKTTSVKSYFAHSSCSKTGQCSDHGTAEKGRHHLIELSNCLTVTIKTIQIKKTNPLPWFDINSNIFDLYLFLTDQGEAR